MKKSERRMILMLIIVAIIIISVLVNIRAKKNNSGNLGYNDDGQVVSGQEEEEIGEFVQVSEDGKKVNVSDKLAEAKTFGNYEISNIRLTEENGKSQILADVKNISETKTDIVGIDITLLDKEGSEIVTIGGIIADIEPGQTTQLNAAATSNFVNAYDFTIKVSANAIGQPAEQAPEQQ